MFFIKLSLGVISVGIIKLIMEVINFLVLIIMLVKSGHKETYQFHESWKEIRQNFPSHLCQFCKLFGSVYIPYMGWELNTFMLGSLKDTNSLSAWVSFQQIDGFFYCVGNGFSNKARTLVSIYIGEKRSDMAKKYATLAYFSNLIIAFIISACMLLFNKAITNFLTDLPDVAAILTWIVFIDSFVVISD